MLTIFTIIKIILEVLDKGFDIYLKAKNASRKENGKRPREGRFPESTIKKR
jgi:hypothetical protein